MPGDPSPAPTSDKSQIADLVADGARAVVDYDQRVSRCQVCDTATQQLEFPAEAAKWRLGFDDEGFAATKMPKTALFAWLLGRRNVQNHVFSGVDHRR